MESVLTSDSSDAVELRQVEQAPARALCNAASPEKLVASLYRSILQREADHGGIAQKLQLIEDGASLEWLITILLQSPEYLNKGFSAGIRCLSTPQCELRKSSTHSGYT